MTPQVEVGSMTRCTSICHRVPRPRMHGVGLCCGALSVFLGAMASAAQLPSVIDLDAIAGNGSPPSLLRVYGDDSDDIHSSPPSNCVGYGDVNGDGYDDAIIGAYGADPPGGAEAGEVYVLYGPGARPVSPVDLNTDGTISGAGETRILGDDPEDWAGYSVAAGDVNGDGYDDVIIGAPKMSDPVEPGEVCVVYGNPGLPASIVDLDDGPGSNGETRIVGIENGNTTGHSVASGDVNGDGYDDVIIGAPDNAGSPRNYRGKVFVVYGSAGLPAGAVGVAGLVASGGATLIYGEDEFYLTGWSVASGDVDADGYDDVILGAWTASPLGRTWTGEVYVLYGGAGLAGSTVYLADEPGSYDETRILGDANGDRTGHALASGDVNGDRYDDIIIGAYEASPEGGWIAGRTYVVYGSDDLPDSVVDLHDAPGSNGETRVLGDDQADRSGSSVACADVNGDGYGDVVIGAVFGAAPPGGTYEGEAYVIYGGPSLPGATLDLDDNDEDVRVLGDNAGDYFGTSAAAGGDIDRDGFPEFAVLAARGDNPSIDPGDNRAGYTVHVYGDGVAFAAVATEAFHAGDTQARGFGSRLTPVIRATLAFSGGTAATATAALTHSGAGITNLGSPDDVADVVWAVNTTRTDWSHATLTLQYLDSEIAGLTEADLMLARARTLAGPWSHVSPAALDTDANTITATVDGLSFFALTDTDAISPTASISLLTNSPSSADAVEFEVAFDEPVAPTFDAGDVTPTGDLDGAVAVTGSGPAYLVTVTLDDPDADGAVGIAVGTEVTDLFGNPYAGGASPLCSIFNWHGFLVHPQDARAYTGDSHTFTVTPDCGATALSYQWKFDTLTAPPPQDVGEDAPSHTVTDAGPADCGLYWCEVTYDGGTHASNAATLEVADHLDITTPPAGGEYTPGQAHVFSVGTTGGCQPLEYTWKKDDHPITGATGASYAIDHLSEGHSGSYTVVVTDAYTDVVESTPPAVLNVAWGAPAAGLAALGILIAASAIAGAGALRRKP